MGGTDFTTKHYAETLDQAFNLAKEDAFYEYGHSGYTGTIAEKPGYEVVAEGVQTKEEAERLIETLSIENDKWGDCFAFEVESDREHLRCFIFFGCASC